jgi:hypothetical protein
VLGGGAGDAVGADRVGAGEEVGEVGGRVEELTAEYATEVLALVEFVAHYSKCYRYSIKNKVN